MNMMELNELKSGWKNAGGALKSEADLQKMTRMANHPSLKKIRTKLIAESIVLLFILLIYYDWFDGDKKPFYANFALVAGLLLYVLNDVIGYISISSPAREENVRLAVRNFLGRIKRLSVYSVIVTFLYSISIGIFFTSVIDFTREKGFIFLFAAIVVVQLNILSYRIWARRIKKLEQQAKDFNLEEGE